MTALPGEPTAIDSTTDWRALAPAARVVRAIAGAIAGLILSALFSAFVLATLSPSLIGGLVVIATVALVGAGLGAWLGQLRWKRTSWKLDALGFHVRRGLLWRTEILVPRSRVQHLDIERGPIERPFAVATLVVHTAGTQTHALRQSGLAERDAVSLRDALIPDAAHHTDAL